MKTTSFRYNRLTAFALLLILPTAYFICISVLKYVLDIDGPFDSSAFFLERMGIKESPGWNINLLILPGPVFALIISVLQLLEVDWQFPKNKFSSGLLSGKSGFR